MSDAPDHNLIGKPARLGERGRTGVFRMTMDMGSGRQVTGAELALGALAEGGCRDHHKIIRSRV